MKALRAKPDASPAPAPTRADGRSRSAVEHVLVGPESDGQRLDNFLLARMRGLPKAMIYRIIRTGQVRINGGRCQAERKVVLGDDVRLPPIELTPGDAIRHGPSTAARGLAVDEVPVVFEDDALIALAKPAGLAVHGGSGIQAGLIERLRASRPEAPFLELVHRLDRDTSGLLLVAKQRKALVAMHRMLAEGRATKHYRALVKGYWGREKPALLQFPLERYVAAEGERRVRVQANGQAAATRVTLVSRIDSAGIAGLPPALSMLDCELLTGRTHQIRVHLAHAGFPLLGDQKYGDFALNKLLDKSGHKRMFLHALSLEFKHPTTDRTLSLLCPLPAAFGAFESALAGWR